MKCLTDSECEQWALNIGIRFERGRYAGFVGEAVAGADTAQIQTTQVKSHGLTVTLTDSTRSHEVMLDQLFRLYPNATGWMLWLRDWGMWGRDDDYTIWHALRERHGDTRPLIESPGHLFGREEEALAKGMTRLVIVYDWDAYLIRNPASVVAFMSHDDYFDLYTPDEAGTLALRHAYGTSGFKPGFKIWDQEPSPHAG